MLKYHSIQKYDVMHDYKGG